jgi:hypothetical protein
MGSILMGSRQSLAWQHPPLVRLQPREKIAWLPTRKTTAVQRARLPLL